MRKTFYLIMALGLIITKTQAQKTETITVKAGSPFDDVFNQMFHFPEFKNGVVIYKDGNGSKGKFNYNLLAGEIQFIGAKGDTLSIANEATIKNVIIGTDTFIYNKQCLQILGGTTKARLAAAKRIKVTDMQKIGAYGLSSSTSSIATYRNFFSENRINDLTLQQDFIFTKTSKYYLVDKNNQILPYTKKNIIKLFPQYTSKIENYLETNTVNLNDEKQLLELLELVKPL